MTVTGKVPKRSLESLSDSDYTSIREDALHLAFEKWQSGFGTGHINFKANSREIVMITVELGADVTLKKLELDNTGGDVTVSLSENFEAIYNLEAHDDERVINKPQSYRGSQSTVTVTNYGHNIIDEK